MNTMQQRAQQLFSNPMADEATVQHNVESWLRAVQYLGPKWHLAETIKLKKIKYKKGK